MSRDDILKRLAADEARQRNVTKESTWEDQRLEREVDLTRKLVSAFAKKWHLDVDRNSWSVDELDRGGKYNQIIGVFSVTLADDIRVRVRVLPAAEGSKPIPHLVWVNEVLLESGDDLRRALSS